MRILVTAMTAILAFLSASPIMATTCTTVAACVLGQNSSTGASSDIGVEGISQRGFGLVGITRANPSKTVAPLAGIYGKDQGPGRYNSGVSAYSQNGTGLTAFSAHGNGVVGTTAQTAYYSFRSGVLGIDTSTLSYNAGVAGQSTNGIGVSAGSTNGTALNTESINGSAFNAISLYGDAIDANAGLQGVGLNVQAGYTYPAVELGIIGPGDFIDGFQANNNNALKFSIDAGGNEILAGKLTTSGGTYARTRSTAGADVAAYGARTASPTLEDFGQGTLRAGAGHIALDPTFASTVDTRSYLVFITPDGDSHGLYTTSRTAKGFDVRESQHGTSSLSFDYRIVGRPLDMATAAHLPAIDTLPQFSATANAHRRFKKMTRPSAFQFHKPASATL